MKITKRLEHKYIISYVDYFKIIDSMRNLLIHDKHGENDSYKVISIYMDDLVFTGAADKAFGNQVHKKYRVRYYDDPSKKKLELKYKVGEESTKYSCTISDEIFNAIIEQDLDVLERHFDEKLIRMYTLDMLKNMLSPICYIKYKREAFKDELDNLRVTFDHSLNVERYTGHENEMEMKLLLDTNLIMEVKFEHYMPRTIRGILKKISLNQIAYSKYFMGYNSLEF